MSRAATELLSALVALDSTNPDLAEGGCGESAVAELCAGRLRQAGLELDIWEPLPGRPNVVGTLRGSGGGRGLMLCGHMDVVAGSPAQFVPEVRDGRLYGRGTYDMKGGIAAALLAAERLAAGSRLRGDVIVALVIDEEWRSVGAEHLVPRHTADAAIFPEPSNLELITDHGGFAWFEVESHGVEAAGTDVEIGRDAITGLAPVLAAIRQLDRKLAAAPPASYGRGSIHASTIQGGDQLPIYPKSCVLGIERCLIPGETWRGAEAEIEQMLAVARVDRDFSATLSTIIGRDPVSVSSDEPIALALLEATAAELGASARIRGEIGWMDSGILMERGIPSVTFGPTGYGEHTAEEWVDLDSVEQCARVYERAARSFCG